MKVRSFIRVMAFWLGPAMGGGASIAQDLSAAVTITYGGVGTPGASWITYGNGMFLASPLLLYAPPGGTTTTSSDGFNWTVHTLTNKAIVGSCRGIAPGSSNFVAFGDTEKYVQDPAGTNGLIQFSADGVVWGEPVAIPSMPVRGAVYANGTYVAVGQSGGCAALAISREGSNWTTRSFPGYGPLRAVAAGQGMIAAVGESGTIVSSTNGLDWTPQEVLTNETVACVAYGNGMFLAGAPYNLPKYILTSTNAIDWNVRASPLPPLDFAPLWAIAYGNGLFVAVTSGISVSVNGLDWTLIWSSETTFQPVRLAYGAGTFSVLAEGGGLIHVNPAYLLAETLQTDRTPDLTVTSAAVGQRCRLQAALTLPSTNWVDLLAFTNQAAPTHFRDFAATNHPQRFYRVALP